MKKTVNLDGLLAHFKNILEKSKGMYLHVDTALEASVLPYSKEIQTENGAVFEGKIILPYKLHCRYGKSEETSRVSSSIEA